METLSLQTKDNQRARQLLRAFSCVMALSIASACADSGKDVAIAKLEDGLKRADRVELYFLSVTDQPTYSVPRFIEAAGVSIVRRCGANCLYKMQLVLEHLREASPIACPRGDQNVVIVVKNVEPLIYGRNGRVVQLGGACYFNERPINDIVESRSFIFR